MTHLMILQLIVIFVLTINQIAAQDPPSDDILIEEFKRFPRKDDCDTKATKDTLRWLTKTDNETSNESDPSMKLLIPSRLRAYLYRKGFLANPGSVHFVNPQSHIIRFKCGKEKNPLWRTQGRLSDSDLKKSRYTNVEFIDKAPTPLLYYRRFSCSSNKCVHYFHVISRPAPKIDFPLQFRQGSNAVFKCAIHKCYYMYDEDECELFDGVEDVIPIFHPPLDFGWFFPKRPNNFYKADANGKIVGDQPKGKFSNFKISWEKFTGKVLNDIKMGDISETFMVSTTIKANKIKKEAAGQFECIVIDQNGVPSKPLKGTENKEKNPGSTYLHVRKEYWTYVPLGIIGILIILTIIFAFCCPSHMEHDDGTTYTKEEMIVHEQVVKVKEAKEDVGHMTLSKNILKAEGEELPSGELNSEVLAESSVKARQSIFAVPSTEIPVQKGPLKTSGPILN